MNDIAHIFDTHLNPDLDNKQVGFVILMFDFNKPENISREKRMNYISNSKREDIIVALKELVANFEGRMQEDYHDN